MAERIKEFLKIVRDASLALFGRDARERKLSLGFWLSLMGVVATLVGAIQVSWTQWKKSRLPTTAQIEETAKLEQEAKKKEYLESLGKLQANLGVFQFPLQESVRRPPGAGPAPNVMIEIVVRCTTVETCEWLKARKDLSRNEMLRELRPVTNDDVLTVDGKKRIKRRLLLRLNQWIPNGQVDEVFFSRVLVQ